MRALGAALSIVAIFGLVLGGGYFALHFAEQRHWLEVGWLAHRLRPLKAYRIGLFALALTVLIYGALLVGIRRYSVQKYRLSWSALYLRHAGWPRYFAMVWLYLPMQLGAGLIVALQTRAAGHAIKNPQHGAIAQVTHHHWFNYVALFVAAAVIAPIVEEILFRGFFYRLLRKRLPAWAAVPISAAVFAVAHGIPVLIPVLFYLGVVMALVAERTRSLYCSMILHALQNGMALVLLFRGPGGL